MAELLKGKVTKVMSGKATVKPFGYGSTETPPLKLQQITIKIPEHTASGVNGSMTAPAQTVTVNHPAVKVNDAVAFVLYEDGTGLIIDKI